MAAQKLFSPAELSYLHSSLSLDPPVRPDGRSPTQFRALEADINVVASANGSARVCFLDGTEAIAGIKLEVHPTANSCWNDDPHTDTELGSIPTSSEDRPRRQDIRDTWVDVSVDIPGFRDDDTLPVLLSGILAESLVATDSLKDRLSINNRFHWKLCLDILLLSAPSSYPLPLMSLTTHLALLATRIPLLISDADEDPLFSDDWSVAPYLYPRALPDQSNTSTSRHASGPSGARIDYPPLILLVATIGQNIIFDPAKEELAVAESVLAVTVDNSTSQPNSSPPSADKQPKSTDRLHVVSIRSIDPPSRLTASGVPDSLGCTNDGFGAAATSLEAAIAREGISRGVVWSPPHGGVKRGLLKQIVSACTGNGGVGADVLTSLKAFS